MAAECTLEIVEGPCRHYMPLASHVYFEDLTILVRLTGHLKAALLNFCVNQLVRLSTNLKMPGGSMHPCKW